MSTIQMSVGMLCHLPTGG